MSSGGIIYFDYIEKGKYVNSDYYFELLAVLNTKSQKSSSMPCIVPLDKPWNDLIR